SDLLGIPLQLPAAAIGDIAQQDSLCNAHRVVEGAEGFPFTFAGVHPFLVMADRRRNTRIRRRVVLEMLFGQKLVTWITNGQHPLAAHEDAPRPVRNVVFLKDGGWLRSVCPCHSNRRSRTSLWKAV